MESIRLIYDEVVWRPLFNGLMWIYATLPGADFGVAIIVFTIILRILLLPLHWKSRKAQHTLSLLQPEVKRIQEKYKDDREAQGRALMELYKNKNVNPFSGCLPVLIQFPVLIALFQIFRTGFDPSLLSYLYSFMPHPSAVDPIAFGFLDLSKGSIPLGLVAAVTQFFQLKVSMPAVAPTNKQDFSYIFQKQSLYLLPLFVLLWANWLPAALTLYWTILNVFGIVQDTILGRLLQRGTAQSLNDDHGHSDTHK